MATDLFKKVLWVQKGTNRKFDFDFEKMKKADYSVSGCRLPISFLTPDEFLLYREGWTDDGESYIVCDKKYLVEVG